MNRLVSSAFAAGLATGAYFKLLRQPVLTGAPQRLRPCRCCPGMSCWVTQTAYRRERSALPRRLRRFGRVAQIGPAPRGGVYTYDWIENLLGLNMHSSDSVLAEFQNPLVGETIGFGQSTMRLERVEPQHALVWRSTDGNWVWSFVLEERSGRHA